MVDRKIYKEILIIGIYMKYKWLFILLLLLCSFTIQAQDKIITHQNDTIHCIITSISDGRVYFEQSADGTKVGKSIPVNQILVYYRNSFNSSAFQERKTSRKPAQRWRFGLHGGLSYMLASTDEAEKDMVSMGTSTKAAGDFYKDLKWGYHAGADVHYMITDLLGLGIRYSLFKTSVNAPLTYYTGDMINYWHVETTERLYVNFIGSSLCMQQWLDQSHRLKLNQSFALGYVHYRDEVDHHRNFFMQPNNALATGNSIGTNVDISLEYFPISWLSISANMGYFASWITKMTITDGRNKQTVKLKDFDLDNENLSRLDFSLCVRFYVK